MLSDSVLQKIVVSIQSCPGFRNVRIGFNGDGRCRVLFEPTETLTGDEDRFAIVLEELTITDDTLIVELQRWSIGHGESPPGAPNPQVVTNRSRVGPELIGAGLACGLTIVAALGVVGGAAAEIPTGGASTFLVYAGWVGLTTAGIQCANGLVRLGAIATSPDDNSLERWDNNRWYSTSILVVDAIGIASGVAALPFQVRNLFGVLSRQKSFIAKGLSLERLRGMNRLERLKVISAVFEDAAKTPEGRAALVQSAREAGLGPRTLQSTKGLSVQASGKIVHAISTETSRRLMGSVRDVLATAAGTTASGLPSSMVGSASGSVNTAISYTLNVIEMSGG